MVTVTFYDDDGDFQIRTFPEWSSAMRYVRAIQEWAADLKYFPA